MNKNTLQKIITVTFVLLMIGTIAITGTLAFENETAVNDADSSTDRISVKLLRQKTGEDGTYEELTEAPVLYPMADGYTENIISVKNNGDIATYNRVLIAVPADLDGSLELVKGDGWKLTKTIENQTCKNENSEMVCNIYIYTMEEVLVKGNTSPAILGVRVNAKLEQYGDTYILDGVTYDYSNGLKLLITAQAVQEDLFGSPEKTFETSGMSENPWMIPITFDSPVNSTALQTVLSELPTGVKITDKVTNVVFGYRSEHESIMDTCSGQPVDDNDPNGPWAYYQETMDADQNSTWTIYILSDSTIYLPEKCDSLFKDMSSLTAVDTKICDTQFVTSMYGMFQGCSNLTNVDVRDWDMSKVTNISQMFYQCSKINNLDVSKWDTSSVTNMSQMFNGCSCLSYLDTSKWDTSNVTGAFNYMFCNCKVLTEVDVDGWVTKDTTSISFMFLNCKTLKSIGVSGWDTSNVKSMDNAFNGCSSVTELDVSKWDTSKVTTTWQMFQNCSELTSLNLTGWNTSNVENMANMFANCKGLTILDISSFDVKNVTKAANMFNGCSELQIIYVSGNAGWDNLALSHKEEIMFASCSNLVGGEGTTFSSQNGSYARIDGGSTAPGYFTKK